MDFWKPTFSLLPVNLLFPCEAEQTLLERHRASGGGFPDARPTERSLAFKTEGS